MSRALLETRAAVARPLGSEAFDINSGCGPAPVGADAGPAASHETPMLQITITIADDASLTDLLLARASEALVARLSGGADRRVDEAVDKAVASICDTRIAAAVDEVLAAGIDVRDEWGEPTGQRIPLAEIVRRYLAAQTDGRQTRLERLIGRAVQDALGGPLAKEIAEAVERVRALLDQAVTRRLAEAVRKAERG